MLVYFLKTIYFILPAIIADAIPILLSKYKFFKFLAKPVDFNKKLNKKPIFGSHKTWRGVIFGIITAIVIIYLQKYLYQFMSFQKISIINYNEILLLGFLMGLGTVMGDLANSFIKRRLGFKVGQRFFGFDELDSMVGAIILISFIIRINVSLLIDLLIIGFLYSYFGNKIAYMLKFKKVSY